MPVYSCAPQFRAAVPPTRILEGLILAAAANRLHSAGREAVFVQILGQKVAELSRVLLKVSQYLVLNRWFVKLLLAPLLN